MNTQLYFNVQTLHVKDGKSLKSIKPDAEGIYRGIPVAVLGKASRNNVFYDIASFINAITNDKMAFYKKLTEGGLEGEWCHPYVSSQSDLARIIYIDRTRISHYFTAIYTKETSDGQFITVYADLVPYGPYGKYLVESFEDPRRNTSFSLRALTTPPIIKNGIQHKKVVSMITFDAVDSGGYEEASKRFATENLCMDFPIDLTDIINDNNLKQAVGFESINNEEIFDMLETDKVIIENNIVGVYDKTHNTILSPDNKRKSVFHTVFKSKGD